MRFAIPSARLDIHAPELLDSNCGCRFSFWEPMRPQVAGFMSEPIQGVGGAVPLADGYLPAVYQARFFVAVVVG